MVAVYSTDEIAVEIAAKALTVYWLNGDKEAEKSLRYWLGKLGFTPGDRTKLDPVSSVKRNQFDDV